MKSVQLWKKLRFRLTHVDTNLHILQYYRDESLITWLITLKAALVLTATFHGHIFVGLTISWKFYAYNNINNSKTIFYLIFYETT